MPSDPLEAEILAMAGALGEPINDDFDSDDSLPEGNLDLGEDQVPDLQQNRMVRFSEDIENIMSGSNIVPKPLPQVTPDSVASHGMQHHQQQAYHHTTAARNHNRGQAMKRRHSGKEGIGLRFLFQQLFLSKLAEAHVL